MSPSHGKRGGDNSVKLKLRADKKVAIPLGSDGKAHFRLRQVMVPPGQRVVLAKDFDPGFTGGCKDKQASVEQLAANVRLLSELQEKLYAQDSYALLLIFQGIDAAGKDGAIQHVLSGVNPQGCHVTSFKVPSEEELDHDYLWRATKALPARGMIGIFNRSHYEEVLVVRVHPELLTRQRLPPKLLDKRIWDRRFEEIRNFERYLTQNGVVILKFFLNLSREEQRERFIARIDEPAKHWKFSLGDYEERRFWDDYQDAYSDMLSNTSTPWAPWFVIPADHKWFSRLAISMVICEALESLDLKFPRLEKERRRALAGVRAELKRER